MDGGEAHRGSREDLLAQVQDDQRSIALSMVRYRMSQLFAHRLSPVQLHALVLLDVDGPLAAGELARRLGVSAATASGLVDRLERDGLAERRHHPDDGRARVVHLAPAGRAAWQEALFAPTAVDERVLAALSDPDVEALARASAALRRAVESVASAPGCAEGENPTSAEP